ncbi:MAG: hypothetical protein ACLVHV_14380 [Oscillospiraceae bacterium]
MLGRIHTLKPNRMEAELLSGVAITDEASLAEAAADACWPPACAGCSSPGGKTASLPPTIPASCASARSDRRRRSTPPAAGDAFMAGHRLGLSWRHGFDGHRLAGACAAAIAIEGAETINPAMCRP